LLRRLPVGRLLLLSAATFAFLIVLGSNGLRTANAQTFTPGATVQVVTDDGGNLNLRSSPSLTATILTSLPDRSFVVIRDGSQQASGISWQFVEAGGFIGWVAAMYLQPLGAVTPTPVPTPAPTVSPTPTPSPTAAPTPSPTPSVGVATIVGPLPTNGRPSLVVWGGGGTDAISTAAAARGCSLRSVWTTADGRLIGYQYGVPDFVNAAWTSRIGTTLPNTSAIMVICGTPGQTSVSAPSSTPSSGASPAAPVSQTQPPGPGGNV